jgi:hypothetical protein
VTEAVDNTPFTVRELQPADAPAMRKLFAAIFQKNMSQALWEWKYARPQSAALGIWRGDELVAHYGGMGVNILYRGSPANAMQICDVMVNPSVRHAVRKQSPFFLATSAFLERYLGYDNSWLLGYGFPSDRHMTLAARLGLYAPVGRMWELNWDLSSQPRIPLLLRTETVDVRTISRQRAALDKLGEQQRGDLTERIVVSKDAAFVEWRYLRHPQERYELLLVKHRLTGEPIGLCVLKVEPERVLWMEALAPLKHLPALAQVARVAAWRLDRRRLSLWCSGPDKGCFGNVTNAQALAITTPANIWTPGPPPEELLDRWWLLASDTDYL